MRRINIFMIVVGFANQEISNNGACCGHASAMRAYTVAYGFQLLNNIECRGDANALAANVAAAGSRPAWLAIVGACSLQFGDSFSNVLAKQFRPAKATLCSIIVRVPASRSCQQAR
jgi:hypothetical protein